MNPEEAKAKMYRLESIQTEQERITERIMILYEELGKLANEAIVITTEIDASGVQQ